MEEKNQYCYKYPRPAVTTDNIILGYGEGRLSILLIERGGEPFKGSWALPGGFMDMNEEAGACARRELQEETGLTGISMEQLYTFSAVDRDPRYRVVSIAFWSLVRLEDCVVVAGDDANKAQWFSLSEMPDLAFDHLQIIRMAMGRLRKKIRFQPVGLDLLPEKFAISDLRKLYESILQTSLNRKNFRRRILSTGLLVEMKENHKGVLGQRERYYSFDKTKYQVLSENDFYLKLE